VAERVALGETNTWYQRSGAGEPLALLHPGGADTRAFEPNYKPLAAAFDVFAPDRRAHGRTADVEGPITYEVMAHDTELFLEQVVGGPAHLVGCSDGAIVALLVAIRRPDLVRKLVVVAGVFHREGWLIPLDENTEPPQVFADAYGEVSPDGIEHYPVVARKLAHMHATEPTLTTQDVNGVTARTLVMVGDDDEVRLEHALDYYRALPDGELATIPGTSHGLLVEKPDLCNRVIVDFLSNDPVPTIAPIRRAGH
jgi:pimeloyl-ACP methyl ester carboxylesterase